MSMYGLNCVNLPLPEDFLRSSISLAAMCNMILTQLSVRHAAIVCAYGNDPYQAGILRYRQSYISGFCSLHTELFLEFNYVFFFFFPFIDQNLKIDLLGSVIIMPKGVKGGSGIKSCEGHLLSTDWVRTSLYWGSTTV